MTKISDAVAFLAARPGFDAKMTRADRRNASRRLYREKRPPKISVEANRQYLEAVQAHDKAFREAVEAENTAVTEMMRTQKTRAEEPMTTTISGG